ncbi:hypothetical protein D1B33_08225 [Lysinibacillus yapensis]|uniref:Peptidase C39-like domain-containing protein n=2 Tax=Ureibacillus yapensis TaxID=2304605 RepID=A0A396S9A3_9BACL|nr:hypothetical protein D1B33_08225 [Lysinibacillus yapensis]
MSFLSLLVILQACSLEEGNWSNQFTTSDGFFNNSNKEGALTVLTVEFGSGAPVPNLNVTITDASSGKIIDSAIGSKEGQAEFSGLKEDKNYLITVSTAESDFPTIEEFTYSSTDATHVIQTHSTTNKRIPVPAVMQNPELPNGCEITALTAVLNYYGLKITKTEMADHYLPRQDFHTAGGKRFGADPNVAYSGSPYEKNNASYVYAQPIVEAAKNVISDKGKALQVTNASGLSQEEILKFVEQGVPVVIWVTLDLSEPQKNNGWFIEGTDTYHEMYQNLHSVVLTGHSEDKVTVMNPLKGYELHDKERFFKSYVQLGKQAVAVHR